MRELYTPLAKMVNASVKHSDNKSIIIIGEGLFNKINDVLKLNINFELNNNIEVYDGIYITTKEKVEQTIVEQYYRICINAVLEMMTIFNFDIEKYKEYQNREFEGMVLYMFTEELRGCMLEQRNMFIKITDIEIKNILLDIESNIINKLDPIVMIICNSYKHLVTDKYLIPKGWISDNKLLCIAEKRS